MIELAKFVKWVGIDRARFHYLFAFGREKGSTEKPVLRTKYQEPARGAARLLSRQNCLEIWFLEEILAANVIFPVAVDLTQKLLKQERAGKLVRWWIYGESLAPSLSDGVAFDKGDSTLNQLGAQLAPAWTLLLNERHPQAKSIKAIDLHEIVARVDMLMERHSDG